jgi:hypothetical protein
MGQTLEQMILTKYTLILAYNSTKKKKKKKKKGGFRLTITMAQSFGNIRVFRNNKY